ncbi:MAG: PAS domain S-box protein [Deltaproteobacteria bacterium]|nr:PAS domain S-box protein [Deltaproteobacteria bacterium]
MKSGLYYSKNAIDPVFGELKPLVRFDLVSSTEELREKFYSSEYDFVYLDIKDDKQALGVIHAAHKLDPGVFFVSHEAFNLPEIETFYHIKKDHLARNMIEALSFHEAKVNHELQVIYKPGIKSIQNTFFLLENSMQGLVLTDARDSIIYMNEAAKGMLNLDHERHLMRQYIRLEKELEQVIYNENEEKTAESYFEYVRVTDSDLYVRVLRKKIATQQEMAGFVYYIEDVTDRQMNAQTLKEERAKYLDLTSRLNDILLKDLTSNAYNLSYLKRKIDLEIKHAKRMQSEVRMIHIGIKDFDQQVSALTLKKAVQEKSVRYLTQKFPEPHIVGNLKLGSWLVILQGNTHDMPKNFRNFCEQMSVFLNEEFSVVKLEVAFMEFVDIKKYNNSQDLMKAIPVW